jgi:hypothetical protein
VCLGQSALSKGGWDEDPLSWILLKSLDVISLQHCLSNLERVCLWSFFFIHLLNSERGGMNVGGGMGRRKGGRDRLGNGTHYHSVFEKRDSV